MDIQSPAVKSRSSRGWESSRERTPSTVAGSRSTGSNSIVVRKPSQSKWTLKRSRQISSSAVEITVAHIGAGVPALGVASAIDGRRCVDIWNEHHGVAEGVRLTVDGPRVIHAWCHQQAAVPPAAVGGGKPRRQAVRARAGAVVVVKNRFRPSAISFRSES